MNHLSYLEKLLEGIEVVWFPIREVTERTTNIKWRETSKSHQYIDLTSVSIDTKKIIETTEVGSSNAPSRAQKLVKRDDVLFATTRPTQMRYCLIDEEYDGAVASTGYCVLRVKKEVTLPKWILHLISSSDFKKYLEENQSGSAYPAISDAKVKDFSIPIPCPDNPEKSLEIQAEIVRILDAFTAMTAELTAELNMRKKQYNYYRNQLLSFDEANVEWKSLGKLAENLDSKRKPITSGQREPGNIPYYGASGIVDYVKDFIFDGDFLLVSEDGANLLARNTPIAFSISGKNWVNNHAHVLKFETYAERRYVEYYLNSIDLTPYISGAAQPKLNKKNLNSISIPNPSLEEKERIVSVLDKFHTLTTSISDGLPREIELRKKQYGYYRDLLLSFPQSNSDEAA
ncbi:restriction endonuclease subunit S [Vibrio parahaemolyticus]|uniref:restriction endonuclease subunit S n=1 Tax=Vibrio parahaemolyticus TaxID=670 RepID=UPI0010E2D92E|nr:restriction endonuclease subunit S [Vibrio parahaemolyticus]HAS6031528.1 restriction endonuclease subunit S [Vibrio vulnificus]EGQ7796067.1 restriction endonuclease subunit S [Vibrio parahaemolyticus]MCX4129174.1 restriction endonuclease subunit S [Vibrio parahaemolyticus]MDF5019364.1 restriction endonuclease subunit S [Vibrio parahaemolyticus]MDF5098570.1 restriction endonuclease subunit S [Vibrio parahaemolyticus]